MGTQRKGDARKADDLFRKIVHSRSGCERCGTQQGPFECAHIIPRNRAAVRCVETNAWLLCISCHDLVDAWPEEKLALVKRTIGEVAYATNRYAAEAFTTGVRPSSRVFWREEVARLKQRLDEIERRVA